MPLTLRGQDSSTGSLLPGLALALLLTGCVAVKPPANVVSPDVGPPCVPPTPVASTPAPIPTGDPATDAMATAAAAAADAHASHMAIAAYHDCLAKKAVR